MNDQVINKVESTRFVGGWKTQTHYLCKRLSRNIGIINKLRHFSPGIPFIHCTEL